MYKGVARTHCVINEKLAGYTPTIFYIIVSRHMLSLHIASALIQLLYINHCPWAPYPWRGFHWTNIMVIIMAVMLAISHIFPISFRSGHQ